MCETHCRCTWEAADTVDAKHVKDYERRLELRVGGKARARALKLPLALPNYVPPGMELKDYQHDGAPCSHLHLHMCCFCSSADAATCIT